MDVDLDTFVAVGKDELNYIREHLLELAPIMAGFAAIGFLLTGPLATLYFAAPVVFAVQDWMTEVRLANGHPEKARTAFVRVVQSAMLSGGFAALKSLLRLLRGSPEQGGLPDISRRPAGKNILPACGGGYGSGCRATERSASR